MLSINHNNRPKSNQVFEVYYKFIYEFHFIEMYLKWCQTNHYTAYKSSKIITEVTFVFS
jgi:hypothetical protein